MIKEKMEEHNKEKSNNKIISILEHLWVRKIGEAETGVAVTFGQIGRIHKSGLCLGPPPIIGKMMRFPTTQFELAYDVNKAITQRSYYYPEIREIASLEEKIEKIIEEIRREEDPIVKEEKIRQLKEAYQNLEANKKKLEDKKSKKEEEAELDESVEIPNIRVIIYLRYSTDDSLKQTIKVLGGPRTPEDLRNHFEGVVIGCFRDIVGTIPWRAVVENREYIVREMQKRFVETGSPFMIAGFKSENLYVTMTVVDLPDVLANLLNLPQQEELKARAAKKVAQRLKAEIGEGIGEAAKILEENYKFPREKAQDVAVERHGDILAAREGELKRIQWITKGSGGSGGSVGGGINPETIAQAVAVAQEIKTKEKSAATTVSAGEIGKKEKKIQEMSVEELQETLDAVAPGQRIKIFRKMNPEQKKMFWGYLLGLAEKHKKSKK